MKNKKTSFIQKISNFLKSEVFDYEVSVLGRKMINWTKLITSIFFSIVLYAFIFMWSTRKLDFDVFSVILFISLAVSSTINLRDIADLNNVLDYKDEEKVDNE